MAEPDTDGLIIVSTDGGGNSDGNAGIDGETSGGNSDAISASGTVIDPAAVPGAEPAPGADSDTGKRKRGRPRGSRNAGTGTSKKTHNLSVLGIENILLSGHAMLAALTKVSLLEMEADEAKRLAQGISDVARHYDLPVTAKTMDWTNLFMLVGEIYGTRLMAYNLQRKMEAAPRPAGPTPRPAATAPTGQPNGRMTTVRIPGVGDVPMPDERIN